MRIKKSAYQHIYTLASRRHGQPIITSTLLSLRTIILPKSRSLSVAEMKKGGNTHVWNTRGEKAETLKGMIFWWATFTGPKAVPGNYKVHLNVNGANQTQEFTIIPDPRAEASVADMQKQHDFISAINATINKAHGSIKKIRGVNKQLDAFTEQYKDNEATKDLVEKAKTMKEGFEEIEKALYQTQNRSNQDPLNFPIRLTNKLAHLNRLVGMGDFPPTAQDVAVQKEMTGKIETQLNRITGHEQLPIMLVSWDLETTLTFDEHGFLNNPSTKIVLLLTIASMSPRLMRVITAAYFDEISKLAKVCPATSGFETNTRFTSYSF